MSQVHHSFCRICEASCGLQIEVDGGRIKSIEPDRDHVGTQGYVCVKGIKQERMYRSPDRLTRPLKRVGEDFVPISWQQAMSEIGAKTKQLRTDHHPNSVGMYIGTAAGFSALHPIFAKGFMDGLGSTSLYATATQDCANKFAAATHVYGFPFTQPFPDIDQCDVLIIVGANPAVSKWSFGQVANPMKRIKAISERGGKVVVVDPRRTETARAADQHLFVRPGTDVFFYLSFLHEVLRKGCVDHERIAQYMTGFEDLGPLVKAWTPERAEQVTGIAPDALRELVATYCGSPAAVLYSSTGVNMGGNGSLCFWLQEVINAITGNLDKEGGTIVGHGIVDFAKFGVKNNLLISEERSRIGNLPKVNDAFAGGVMADEILTPGDRQLRALFVTGGNPLITMPNAERLGQAFDQLEMLVVVDIFLNETASKAHYVLPATSPFQRPDLPFVFPLLLGMQTRPYLQATRKVVEPEGEQRDEASIYLDLATASGSPIFGSRLGQWALQAMKFVHSFLHPKEQAGLPQILILDLLLRITRQPSFKKLLRHKHGYPLPQKRDGTFLGQRVVTPDAKVHLAPPALLQAAKTLEDTFEKEVTERAAGGLRLITRRHLMTHNSWTHNLDDFVDRQGRSNQLYMHPEDASAHHLSEGDLVDVESKTGKVRLPLEFLDTLMPGVVALPHGWGHQHAKGLSVASATSGVNVNILAADGAEHLEPISGMARLTGIPVQVRAAEGPRDVSNWSGISVESA